MQKPPGLRLGLALAVSTFLPLLSPLAAAPAAERSDLQLAVKADVAEEGKLATLTLTPDEEAFIELCNAERRKRNLKPLKFEPLLTVVARRHSAEMRDRSYFNHRSPTQGRTTPMDRFLDVLRDRPAYLCVGENLFYCSVTDVHRGHRAFMTSPAHRDNVLDPDYEQIGVGIARNSKGEFWVTQMFLNTNESVRRSGRGSAEE